MLEMPVLLVAKAVFDYEVCATNDGRGPERRRRRRRRRQQGSSRRTSLGSQQRPTGPGLGKYFRDLHALRHLEDDRRNGIMQLHVEGRDNDIPDGRKPSPRAQQDDAQAHRHTRHAAQHRGGAKEGICACVH